MRERLRDDNLRAALCVMAPVPNALTNGAIGACLEMVATQAGEWAETPSQIRRRTVLFVGRLLDALAKDASDVFPIAEIVT
jgi:hypothetical protein